MTTTYCIIKVEIHDSHGFTGHYFEAEPIKTLCDGIHILVESESGKRYVIAKRNGKYIYAI